MLRLLIGLMVTWICWLVAGGWLVAPVVGWLLVVGWCGTERKILRARIYMVHKEKLGIDVWMWKRDSFDSPGFPEYAMFNHFLVSYKSNVK